MITSADLIFADIAVKTSRQNPLLYELGGGISGAERAGSKVRSCAQLPFVRDEANVGNSPLVLIERASALVLA